MYPTEDIPEDTSQQSAETGLQTVSPKVKENINKNNINLICIM